MVMMAAKEVAHHTCTRRSSAHAAPPPAEDHKILCDQECVAQLDKFRSQTLKSGVRIVDIKEGTGVEPRVGYQARHIQEHGPLLHTDNAQLETLWVADRWWSTMLQ